jgi:hypothetical protein
MNCRQENRVGRGAHCNKKLIIYCLKVDDCLEKVFYCD